MGNLEVYILFEVAELKRPLLCVAKLTEDGWKVNFEVDGVALQAPDGDHVIHGRKDHGLYVVEAVLVNTPEERTDTANKVHRRRKGIEVAPLEAHREQGEARQEGERARGVKVPERGSEGPPQAVHGLTHIPFQPWREACVMARARDDPHHARPRPVDGTLPVDEWPLVEYDYSFGRVEGGKTELKRCMPL